MDRLHRGDHARGGDRRDEVVGQRLEVLEPVAPAAPPRDVGRRARSARRRRRSCASRPGSRRAAKRSISVREPLRVGPEGREPSPCVSGASSQAVPASITPSAKNLATPPRHSRPRASRRRQLRLDLLVAGLRRHATAARAGAWSAPRCPRGRAGGRASRARRPSRARRSARARSAAAARATWRARISGQRRPRRGAQHEVLRARLAQLAGRDAVDADDLDEPSGKSTRPGHLRQLQRARASPAPCAGPRAARTPPRRRPPRRSRAASAPRRSPAPRRTASRARRRLAASAASTSSCVRAAAQIGAAGELRAPERVQVRVDQPGDQRLRRARAGPRCARRSRADLGLVADGDDRRRLAPRRRSRTAAPGRASGRARRRWRDQRPRWRRYRGGGPFTPRVERAPARRL